MQEKERLCRQERWDCNPPSALVTCGHFGVPAFVYCNHLSWLGSWCDHNNVFSTRRPEEGLCVSAWLFLLHLPQSWSLTGNSTVRTVYLELRSKLCQQLPLAYVGSVAREGHQLFAAMKWTEPGAGKVSCQVLALPLLAGSPLPAPFYSLYHPPLRRSWHFVYQGFSTSNEVHISTWKHFTKFY